MTSPFAQPAPVVHDFYERLAYSHSQSDQPWWEQVYRQAFPAFSAMHDVRQDGWAQRAGIDRQVLLTDGTVLKVDEKVRSVDYGDILLEYWSSEEHRRVGWVAKELSCDFIAYAIEPSRTCYLLPFQVLRRVWRTRGPKWVEQYESKRARNKGYTTVSLAVPTAVLLDAIRDALVISWAETTAA